MQVRGYCSYKITMPTGKRFAGEKLLIQFNQDALRAMEHQADLIAIAHDIRLKERRPINIDDREWVSNAYRRFHGWMSGGSNGSAKTFFQENGLVDFYWGMGVGGGGSMGFYGSGGSTSGRFPEFDIHGAWGKYAPASATPAGRSRVNYPAECFLPIRTVKYGGERVIDFSNPLTIKLERERAFQAMAGREKETGRVQTGECGEGFQPAGDGGFAGSGDGQIRLISATGAASRGLPGLSMRVRTLGASAARGCNSRYLARCSRAAGRSYRFWRIKPNTYSAWGIL